MWKNSYFKFLLLKTLGMEVVFGVECHGNYPTGNKKDGNVLAHYTCETISACQECIAHQTG